jgi:hypothetical protein
VKSAFPSVDSRAFVGDGYFQGLSVGGDGQLFATVGPVLEHDTGQRDGKRVLGDRGQTSVVSASGSVESSGA